MLVDGFILGLMTSMGFFALHQRLPVWAKAFVQKHPLLTDVGVAAGIYLLLGFTLSAHMAAAFAALTLPVTLILSRNERFVGVCKVGWQKVSAAWSNFLGLLEGKLEVQPVA